MHHAPRRLVSDADLALQFEGGNAVAAGLHQEHGEVPRFERCGGLVENAASGRVNLEPAHARIGAASGNRGELVFPSAIAGQTVRVAAAENVNQASGVIGELFVELVYRVLLDLDPELLPFGSHVVKVCVQARISKHKIKKF